MTIKVKDYFKLSEKEKGLIDNLTKNLPLYQQLWYVASLSDQKVKVFIFGKYETIFFVPYRSKLGIQYAYMPSFLQKLSFVGSQKGVEPIIFELRQYFRFGEISLLSSEYPKIFDSNQVRKNYVLPLEKAYEELIGNFSENHRRNCRKAKPLMVKKVGKLDELKSIFNDEKSALFSRKQMGSVIGNLNKFESDKKLSQFIEIYNALDGEQTVASILIFKHNKIIYYLLGSFQSMNKSLSNLGLFKLFDFLIEKYSNDFTELDFEGSDIPGIARFYKGFGSKETSYQFLKWNRLPFPLNRIKK